MAPLTDYDVRSMPDQHGSCAKSWTQLTTSEPSKYDRKGITTIWWADALKLCSDTPKINLKAKHAVIRNNEKHIGWVKHTADTHGT